MTAALLGAVPLLLLGLLLIADRYRTRRHLTLDTNLQIARLTSAFFSGWIEGQMRTLHTLAEADETVYGTRSEKLGLVRRQVRAQPEWDDLFITDARGQQIVDVARTRFVGDRAYFQRVAAMRRPVVSHVLRSRNTGQQSIIFAYPIQANGQFRGIVAAVVGVHRVQQVFRRVPHESTTRLGLWEDTGTLIACSDENSGTAGRTYRGGVLPEMLSRRMGTVIGPSPVTGQVQFFGYAPVPDTPWVVTAGTPRAAAITPVLSSLVAYLLLATVVVILSLSWSLYNAGVLARQVQVLVDGAQAIGAGKFATRVTMPTGDELEILANALNGMAADLAVAERIQSDFLSIVSHELKTPLTAIRTALDMLTSGDLPPDTARYAETLQIAERQARRLQDMIENVLNVARERLGALTVAPAPTPLSTIINASVREYREAATLKGLAFTVDVPPELRVNADVPRITLVVNNLLDNAVKFTQAGGITVRAEGRDGEAVVTVADTGSGLTPEARRSLFQPFAQPEPALTRKAGGAGLGLSVVKALVEAHGGRVFFDSPGPGLGSTFGFTLPLAE
jgi:signal transduction histidine kinase